MRPLLTLFVPGDSVLSDSSPSPIARLLRQPTSPAARPSPEVVPLFIEIYRVSILIS
ncbi:hypothetical protein HAX54_017935, partial [Datura stramonium]|nr:hypothetical protein [Datura stramonium]